MLLFSLVNLRVQLVTQVICTSKKQCYNSYVYQHNYVVHVLLRVNVQSAIVRILKMYYIADLETLFAICDINSSVEPRG